MSNHRRPTGECDAPEMNKAINGSVLSKFARRVTMARKR